MPGFFGFISPHQSVLNQEVCLDDIISPESGYIDKEAIIRTDSLYGRFFQHTLQKFEKDKVFAEDNEQFCLLDGVILNKYELYQQYDLPKEAKMFDLLDEMQQNSAEKPFFHEFRGTFAGIHLDKKVSQFRLYTNHIGDREVFYYRSEETGTLYFATDFNALIKLIYLCSGSKFSVYVNAAYSLLTHGHTLCNDTLFKNVKRLTPGNYLVFTANTLLKKSYYTLQNTPIQMKEQEALKKLDYYFRRAVTRSFKKDLEYGYQHLVALSGGLDSRMTTWVAHDLGYTNILNYTFSQSDYLDESVPKEITQKLQHEWIFKALDNGLYLSRYFADAIKLTGGRSQNAGISHTLSMLQQLNIDKYGLIHTGQLGDVIIGTYYDQGKKQSFQAGDGAASKRLIRYVDYSVTSAEQLDDQELFKFYNRGFTGVNIGLKPMYQYSETISPFLDVDFLNFCLTMPLEYRHGHRIYLKWINQYYPEAAEFVYEKVGGKINRKTLIIKGVPVPWTSIPRAAVKLIRKKLGLKYQTKKHMNPLDYWFQTNENLRHFYETEVKTNIDFVQDKLLKEHCQLLFNKGNALEKDQVMTFIYFLKDMKDYIKWEENEVQVKA